MENKKYTITEEKLQEINYLISQRSLLSVKNILKQLEKIKPDESKSKTLEIYKEFFDKVNGVLMGAGKRSLVSKSDIESLRFETKEKLNLLKKK